MDREFLLAHPGRNRDDVDRRAMFIVQVVRCDKHRSIPTLDAAAPFQEVAHPNLAKSGLHYSHPFRLLCSNQAA